MSTDTPAPVLVAPLPTAAVSNDSVLLSASAGVVGLLSYTAGLLMTHLLPTVEYGRFAAAQMLVTVAGTVASALIPLPLARAVRACPAGSPERGRAVAFAMAVALCAGLVAAVGTGLVASGFASLDVAVAVAVSALAVFLIAPIWGCMQGEGRFRRYATTSVAEVVVRLAASAAIVVAGFGAAGAVAAFAVGAAAVVAVGLPILRREAAWQTDVLRDRHRWVETRGIAVTQLVLSVIVAADVLVVAFLDVGSPEAAGFQALSTLAKGPVYVAAGCVLVTFPMLRAGVPQAAAELRRAFGTFGRIAALAAVLLATVPASVVGIVLPPAYLAATAELPWLAVAGAGYGLTMVLATTLVALGSGRRSLAGLATAVVALAAGLLGGNALGGVHGLAVGATAGAVLGAATLAVLAMPVLPAGTLRPVARAVGFAVPGLTLLVVASGSAPLWCGVAALVAGATVNGLRAGNRGPGAGARLRILHLGFEDPAMPGSGGGALRTHETGRRIARSHDLTVLVQRFPGCTDRTEDGVRYVHIGIGAGRSRLTRVLGYMAMLPVAVRTRPADIVVEDFFAPVSTIGAPLWTGRPTVGVVQWLNAREKAAQFKVPVHLVERFGVRRHRRLVAVSEGIRDRLVAVNPGLTVDVIGNGVGAEAFDATPRLGDGVVFVGRLEIAQKGLDLLLDAWARACCSVAGELVIAGVGPDEQRLREQVAALGIAERVRFVGWVAGRAKAELLASARLVAVPSRFETFGIVAVEAAAAGTPVLAFDIDCLREVVPAVCGIRVAPFDVEAYADALVAAYRDEAWIVGGAQERRTFARGYDWDAVAARQERFYVTAAREQAGRP